MDWLLKLLTPKAFGLAGVVILGLVLALFVSHQNNVGLQGRLDTAKADMKLANDALDREKSANVALLRTIGLQNAQVTAWKRAADERETAAIQAMQKADAATAKAKAMAGVLYSIKPSGDECHDLQNLIDTYLAAGADGVRNDRNSGSRRGESPGPGPVH